MATILCENCRLRPAVVELTRRVDGEQATVRLCNHCASAVASGTLGGDASLESLVERMFGPRLRGREGLLGQLSEMAQRVLQRAAQEALAWGQPRVAREAGQVRREAGALDEYRKNIEKDAALERRFQPVMIAERTPEQAIEILRGLRDSYEAHHRVKITDAALTAAVELSDKYVPDRFLPDKAIDLMDEAAAMVRLGSGAGPDRIAELERRLAQRERPPRPEAGSGLGAR